MQPFRDGDTSATFRGIQEAISHEIDGLSNDYVLNAAPTELEEYFIGKGRIDPIVLHVDEYYVDSQSNAKIDVSHDFLRMPFADGRPIIVSGTELRVAIPFEGDPQLWRLRASTYSRGGYPDIEIRDDRILVRKVFADDSVDADALRREISHDIQALASAVGHLEKDVQTHIAALRQLVPGAIERKRQKALAATRAVAALGIPMKRTQDPPTFTLPARRRSTPVTKPKVATGKYEPEPVLAAAEYDHILSVVRSMSLVIERNPASFASLDEEAIRDHFLLQLNGHYEGGATGETFNASGKTDILIRSGNRNVFIAECKFWRGPKQFGEAIDQLMSYLTWRDSKTALLVFNKNRDAAAVREKMHETVVSRSEHKKTLVQDALGDGRYVLVKEADPGREIVLTTQLYDLPSQSGRD